MAVSSLRDGGLPQAWGDPVGLEWPLDAANLDDLRWYLERYLTVPFGAYEDRGTKIATRLPGWGEALFSAVFKEGPARDAYVRLRERSARPGATEIVVRSAAPEWLALPWELMRDPDRPSPLALDGVGLSRSLPAAQLGDAFPVGGRRLRVLMVVSRPRGTGDVGYHMIARPLLRRLAAVRGQVEVVVLRPPTLEALEATLREADEPFQIVHFDGHGVLTGERATAGSGAPVRYGQDGHGVLVFEKPGGGADEVSAERIAQVLAEARVPVVVLNACHSGAVGKELEVTVATRLLAGGAAAVVAMAYSIYAVAAAEFMTAFYERLFAGDTVGEAVRAGRARMALRPHRPSPKGKLPLADWLIPVHYLRRDVRFPELRATRTGLSLDEALDRLRTTNSGESGDDLAAVGEFVGRDALFYTLELAARTQRVVLLHGPAGTGKTEAAKAFGRWWRDTGGVDRPDLVIVHSFKPGVASFGLHGVVAAIGNRAFGPNFALQGPDTRRELVHQLLEQHRVLLIWDNFETVASMPDPSSATPPLDTAGRRELADFLARVAAGGRSAILITSRTPEPWLDTGIRRVKVGGLSRQDSIDYADLLLESFPAATPRRADRAFEELMDWLDGHPLSMRVMLPHLGTTNAATLLDRLRGTTTLSHADDEHVSLAASLTYSLAHLDPADRDLLVAVSLFDGVVDANILGLFSRHEHLPARFRGRDAAAWAAVLGNAAHVGLLTSMDEVVYAIHPALPAYLAGQWRADHPDRYATERDAAERALLDAYAVFAVWIDQQVQTGDATLAFLLIHLHRRTLGRLLGHALDAGLWEHAHAFAVTLNEFWYRKGLTEEARHWTDRARHALEGTHGIPPSLDQPPGALWLFLAGAQANRAVVANDLDSAAAAYTDIYDMLLAQPDSPRNRERLAGTYHQLGMVAQLRGWLDKAEQWYHKALTIKEELGNRTEMANTYHQLGIVDELRDRLDEAERWHNQALTIRNELGDRPGIANSYHELGAVAQLRERLDDAEQRYHRARIIREDLHNRPDMAITYHQLGMVARLRGRLDEAEQWYHQALTINEELGNRLGLAATYHEIGIVSDERGRLDEAEQWYHQALTINKELGNRLDLAMNCAVLGVLAARRDDAVGAVQWMVRCVSLFDEFPHPSTKAGATLLARLTRELGIATVREQWTQVTGEPLPAAVQTFVENHREESHE